MDQHHTQCVGFEKSSSLLFFFCVFIAHSVVVAAAAAVAVVGCYQIDAELSLVHLLKGFFLLFFGALSTSKICKKQLAT